jgi:hypothetical protein
MNLSLVVWMRRVAMKPMMHDGNMICRKLSMRHLDPSEDLPGTRVELDHLGSRILE